MNANEEAARNCLRLIARIADRGAATANPEYVGYALQELTQALYERTGSDDVIFEPISATGIPNLDALQSELCWVDCSMEEFYDRSAS